MTCHMNERKHHNSTSHCMPLHFSVCIQIVISIHKINKLAIGNYFELKTTNFCWILNQ